MPSMLALKGEEMANISQLPKVKIKITQKLEDIRDTCPVKTSGNKGGTHTRITTEYKGNPQS